MSLTRFSEPYADTGGMASEGVRNLLGRPKIEPLELLVREAIQNSWDARLERGTGVRVEITLHTLTAAQRNTLRTSVVPDPPPKLPLGDQLRQDELRLLTFADRNTRGLEGGIRSSTTREGEPSDFVDFVRNIGQPPDREFGAGSFGYGKGAFYLLSRASTVIVHTRVCQGSSLESRLIVCALGEHYNDAFGEGIRRTGRHWWGEVVDGVVDPLIGPAADEMAASLGLPPFGDSDSGTSVAIIAPRLELSGEDGDEDIDEEDPHAAMSFMGEAIAWSFWPRMIASTELEPTMHFALTLDGAALPVPDPATHSRLGLFTSAMRTLRGQESQDAGLGGVLVDAWCQRPRRRLGRISLRRGPVTPIHSGQILPFAARAMEDRVHHVALMREAEFVVRYEVGPPLAGDHFGYAGVFKSDVELDEIFRQSEPPTHDDWEPRSLPKAERRFVNVALKRVKEVTARFASPPASRAADAENLPLGEFSAQLAGLMPTLPGPGGATPAAAMPGAHVDGGAAAESVGDSGAAGQGPAGGGDGSSAQSAAARPAQPTLEIIQPATPTVLDDEVIVQVTFRIHPSARSVRVSAKPAVMTLDGVAVEREAPQGAQVPQIVAWVSPDGAESYSSGIETSAVDQGIWTLRVSHVPDAVVRVELDAQPV